MYVYVYGVVLWYRSWKMLVKYWITRLKKTPHPQLRLSLCFCVFFPDLLHRETMCLGGDVVWSGLRPETHRTWENDGTISLWRLGKSSIQWFRTDIFCTHLRSGNTFRSLLVCIRISFRPGHSFQPICPIFPPVGKIHGDPIIHLAIFVSR